MNIVLQPKLQRVPIPSMEDLRGHIAITMHKGQWDGLLAAAYAEGATLLEVGAMDAITAAYRKPQKTESL